MSFHRCPLGYDTVEERCSNAPCTMCLRARGERLIQDISRAAVSQLRNIKDEVACREIECWMLPALSHAAE